MIGDLLRRRMSPGSSAPELIDTLAKLSVTGVALVCICVFASGCGPIGRVQIELANTAVGDGFRAFAIDGTQATPSELMVRLKAIYLVEDQPGATAENGYVSDNSGEHIKIWNAPDCLPTHDGDLQGGNNTYMNAKWADSSSATDEQKFAMLQTEWGAKFDTPITVVGGETIGLFLGEHCLSRQHRWRKSSW
jgi:hypothetical protein